MRNRRTIKILTGSAIVLGVVLCLLAGALFLEDQDGHNVPTTPGESAPVETQGNTSAGLSDAVDPVASDTSEDSGKESEQEATSPSQSGQEFSPAESAEPEASKSPESGQEESKPAAASKPAESSPQKSESGESEAAEPTTSGNEAQTSSRPTEPGPAETVPEPTLNDNNVTPDDEL